MALTIPASPAKLLYGVLFAVLLPLALAAWAHGARSNISLPALSSVTWGAAVALVGVVLWVAGVISLRLYGGGLPMNAFPPARLVTRGVYAVIAHPIYTGFALISLGFSIASGSAAGQWLVSPVAMLAASALWWGYERLDLQARLGTFPRAPWLGVPLSSPEAPRFQERLGALFLALIVPAITSWALYRAGLAGAWAYQTDLSRIRVFGSVGLVVAAALAAQTCEGLRELLLSSWLGSLVLALFTFALPIGTPGERLVVAADGVLLAAIAMVATKSLLGFVPGIRPVVRWAFALAAGLPQMGPKLLRSPEFLLGVAIFTLVAARWTIWKAALRWCEWVANCWRESEFGAVRILHIGWFAALPAFGGAAFSVILLGPGSTLMTVCAFISILVGSALWAQIIEGSPALSRPYGFFGGVAAIAVFAVVIAPPAFNVSPWLVFAAFATVAPWTQAAARLRCFANGCCHGAPCPGLYGVVYRNPHTRVVRMAHLGGVPIHPTQLYSLTGNVIIGILILRLWLAGAPLALITGLYLALMGLARFVEEAMRGEPQTPIYGGLRLYQWVSIACLIGGSALTAVPGTLRAPAPVPSLEALWAGIAAGSLIWVAVSVDFPHSQRRFARLA
jgi:protein-S-isoprenylcysteine O-methyltransferase Ste14